MLISALEQQWFTHLAPSSCAWNQGDKEVWAWYILVVLLEEGITCGLKPPQHFLLFLPAIPRTPYQHVCTCLWGLSQQPEIKIECLYLSFTPIFETRSQLGMAVTREMSTMRVGILLIYYFTWLNAEFKNPFVMSCWVLRSTYEHSFT